MVGNAMKNYGALLIASMLLVSPRGDAQTARPSLSGEQAIRAASQLSLGMKEEKAMRLLESKGFEGPLKMGCSHGWTCFYPLADGTSLGLDIAPVRARADGLWRNGLLRAAYIQKNGTNASIALKPGSLPSDDSPLNQDWQILGVAVLAACALFGAAIAAIERKTRPA